MGGNRDSFDCCRDLVGDTMKQSFTEIERMKLTLIQMYPYVESKDISDIVDRVIEWTK